MQRYSFKKTHLRIAASILDGVGSLFFNTCHNKPLISAEIKKILIVRLDHLGDLILSRPAFFNLRKQFPNSKIHLMLPDEYEELFKHASEIDKLIPISGHWFDRLGRQKSTLATIKTCINIARNEQYDLGIDFRGDFRHILLMQRANIRHRLGYGITGGGFLLTHSADFPEKSHIVTANNSLIETALSCGKPESYLPGFSFSNEYLESVLKKFMLKDIQKSKKIVFIHSGAGTKSKKWPVAHFSELVLNLGSRGDLCIVLIGSKNDQKEMPELKTLPYTLDLRGETSLTETTAMLTIGRLFIGGDSGPAHLAASQNIPVISIFSGANDPKRWRPWTQNLILLTHAVSCSPCESIVCVKPKHDCMQNILPEQVIAAATSILNGASQ